MKVQGRSPPSRHHDHRNDNHQPTHLLHGAALDPGRRERVGRQPPPPHLRQGLAQEGVRLVDLDAIDLHAERGGDAGLDEGVEQGAAEAGANVDEPAAGVEAAPRAEAFQHLVHPAAVDGAVQALHALAAAQPVLQQTTGAGRRGWAGGRRGCPRCRVARCWGCQQFSGAPLRVLCRVGAPQRPPVGRAAQMQRSRRQRVAGPAAPHPHLDRRHDVVQRLHPHRRVIPHVLHSHRARHPGAARLPRLGNQGCGGQGSDLQRAARPRLNCYRTPG